MRAVVNKFCFAVGSHACMIAGALDILGIGNMYSFALCGSTFPLSLSTLCSPPSVDRFSMALIAFPNILMSFWPLCVFDAMPVAVSNSSVSAFKCALLLRFGTWQCRGKSLADPEILYARISGTSYKLHQ